MSGATHKGPSLSSHPQLCAAQGASEAHRQTFQSKGPHAACKLLPLMLKANTQQAQSAVRRKTLRVAHAVPIKPENSSALSVAGWW